MALFSRGPKKEESGGASAAGSTNILVGREVYCSVCKKPSAFTRCWRRVKPERQCACCGFAFADLRALYSASQPSCPQCAEPLEQPNFDYGLCDSCGSKFEILEGTKPSLFPNREQRQEMDKHGKAHFKKG